MLLKRHFDRPDGWQPKRNLRGEDGKLKDPSRREGDVLNPPPLKHIEVKHTGVKPEQNFSEKIVNQGIKEGWITLSRGKLILHAVPDDLEYSITRTPGHYCCHCGKEIPDGGLFVPDEKNVTFGTRHVQEAHGGKESPDPTNPAGYMRINQYETVLDEKQHARYRLGAPRKEVEGEERPRARRR